MEEKRGVDILVVSDDFETRSMVTALISEKLGEVGFADRRGMVDLIPVLDNSAVTLLGAMRENNPQLFEVPVFITAVERARVDVSGGFTVIDQTPPADNRPFSPGWVAAVQEVVVKGGTVSQATKDLIKAEFVQGTFVGPLIDELKDTIVDITV
jgi:hypothetical protein